MTATFDRPPLGALSTNTLNRPKPNKFNPTLSKMSTIAPKITIGDKQHPIQNPKTLAFVPTNAEKLKYRLQLAYYKLRTNQVTIPVSEIMRKEDIQTAKFTKPTASILTTANTKVLNKKPNVTPSLTRHISLLAASTPLNGSKSTIKKRVSFQNNNNHTSPAKAIFKTNVNFASSFSKLSRRPNQLSGLSSPDIDHQNHRSLKIDDLCNTTGSTMTNDNDDETINEVSMDSTILENSTHAHTVTPIKRRLDDNGDLIMSSPTKKLCSSTPGSYGAAKSLLQLSVISST